MQLTEKEKPRDKIAYQQHDNINNKLKFICKSLYSINLKWLIATK